MKSDTQHLDYLFYDELHAGHHGEYLVNLILSLDPSTASLSVIVAPEVLRSRLERAMTMANSPIRLDFIPLNETGLMGGFALAMAGLHRVNAFIEKYKVRHVYLMYVNMFLPALPVWRPCATVRVRGIYFNTSLKRPRGLTVLGRLKFLAWSLRKRCLFCAVMMNPVMDRLFVLNDSATTEALRPLVIGGKRRVADICDPISAAMYCVDGNVVRPPRPDGRKILLLAGAISERKGVLETLHAIEQLDDNNLSRVALRIIGRSSDPCMRSKLDTAIAALCARRPVADIFLRDEFIDETAYALECRTCDAMLIPYVHFTGSSGMVGLACLFGKPVIATDECVVGSLTRRLHIGDSINPKDADAYAHSIVRFLDYGLDFDSKLAADYVERSSFRSFCNTLVAR
jgi:hypothetical protein